MFFLDSSPGSENEYLKNFFEVEIKFDVLLLRMVLDTVNLTLRQIQPLQDAYDNSNFLTESKAFDKQNIGDAFEKISENNTGVSLAGFLS